MHALQETVKRNFELKRRRVKKKSIELLFLLRHQLMRSITILIIPTLFFSDNYCYQQDIKMRFDPLPNGWLKLAFITNTMLMSEKIIVFTPLKLVKFFYAIVSIKSGRNYSESSSIFKSNRDSVNFWFFKLDWNIKISSSICGEKVFGTWHKEDNHSFVEQRG